MWLAGNTGDAFDYTALLHESFIRDEALMNLIDAPIALMCPTAHGAGIP
jgi:hypothetical protein